MLNVQCMPFNVATPHQFINFFCRVFLLLMWHVLYKWCICYFDWSNYSNNFKLQDKLWFICAGWVTQSIVTIHLIQVPYDYLDQLFWYISKFGSIAQWIPTIYIAKVRLSYLVSLLPFSGRKHSYDLVCYGWKYVYSFIWKLLCIMDFFFTFFFWNWIHQALHRIYLCPGNPNNVSM